MFIKARSKDKLHKTGRIYGSNLYSTSKHGAVASREETIYGQRVALPNMSGIAARWQTYKDCLRISQGV